MSDFTNHLSENVVKFTLRYDAISYRVRIEEKKKTWDRLLGEIGGHLHMFMGMSLLSFVEIFEFLL